MSKTIQIRNISNSLHRKLKSRAAVAGLSLSDYLRGELERIATLQTHEELLQQIHKRSRVTLIVPVAEVIRRQRGVV